jgi:hypothetical protein
MDKKEKAFGFFTEAVARDENSEELFFEFCPDAKEDPLFYES